MIFENKKVEIDLEELIMEEINFVKEDIKYHNLENVSEYDIRLYIKDHIHGFMEEYAKDIIEDITPEVVQGVLNEKV